MSLTTGLFYERTKPRLELNVLNVGLTPGKVCDLRLNSFHKAVKSSLWLSLGFNVKSTW